MKPKTMLFLTMSLTVGIVASIGMIKYGKQQKTEPIALESEQRTFVLIASANIQKGTALNESMLQLKKWPSKEIPPEAIQSPGDAIGKIAKEKVYTGEPIFAGKLSLEGAQRKIPTGMRIVPVEVGLGIASGNLIQPGDHADVILVHEGTSLSETVAKPILENVIIWGIHNDPHGTSAPSNLTGTQTVSLVVSPKEAGLLTLASNTGHLCLTLRSANDPVTGNIDTVSMQDVLQESLEQQPQPVTRQKTITDSEEARLRLAQRLPTQESPTASPTSAEEAGANEQHWSMEILQGSELAETRRFPDSLGKP
ncbi:MAG: Flp pilus assembly protein CpaB [Planctomycetes bacterium]|nr:Flp pilus assembly protein CpaB [Planctomycetota bacterium]